MPSLGTRAPQTGTARIRGRIVAAQTGTPLRRAQVTLGVPASQARSTLTDSDGRFEFDQLPAGRYAIVASKTGFVTLQYGQRRPTDVTDFIVLADGERRDSVDLALPRGGVIAVRVTDDFGDPLPSAQVQVQRYQYSPDGQRRLNSVFVPGAIGQTATDDRGEVRMYGLPPGEYVVSAMLRNNGVQFNPDPTINEGFALTYHPGTVNPAEAQTVTVSLAEETLIEFAMSSARLTRVSGTVVDSQGRPSAGSFVNIVTRQGNGMSSTGGGQVAPDGTFTLNGVAPGDYSLEVRTQLRPGVAQEIEFGSTPITVAGAEITGVRIVTGRGATISGRVIFEGTAAAGPLGSGTTSRLPESGRSVQTFHDRRHWHRLTKQRHGRRERKLPAGRTVRTRVSPRVGGRLGHQVDQPGWRGRHRRAARTHWQAVGRRAGDSVDRQADADLRHSQRLARATIARVHRDLPVGRSAGADRRLATAANGTLRLERVVPDARHASGTLRRDGHHLARAGPPVRARVPGAAAACVRVAEHSRGRDARRSI